MSDNTPFSGSAGPHLGKKRGFSAWISNADPSAIKSNLTKAGQTFKKNLLQHKGADTAGCSVGIRELGDDGFARYNIDGEAIYIAKRSNDVFSDDEFVDAGSGQFVGRRMSAPQVTASVSEAVVPGPSTFMPDLGRPAAPKTFKGTGFKDDAAVPVASQSTMPAGCESIMNRVSKRVTRIESPIDWSDSEDDGEGDVLIMTEPSVDEPVVEDVQAPAVEEPAMKVPAEASVEAAHAIEEFAAEAPVVEDVIEDAAMDDSAEYSDEVVEDIVAEVTSVDEPVVEDVQAPAVSAVEGPAMEVPAEASVEAAHAIEEFAAEAPVVEAAAMVAVPSIERIEAVPMEEIRGLYTEGDAESVPSVVSGTASDDSVAVATSAAVEIQASVPVTEAPAEPRDLSAYGINGVTDPVVSRPRPRYRTYRISGGRICDSDAVEGKEEAPQRPLD